MRLEVIMEKKEFYLPSSDGRSRLHCVQWIPDGPVTASKSGSSTF